MYVILFIVCLFIQYSILSATLAASLTCGVKHVTQSVTSLRTECTTPSLEDVQLSTYSMCRQSSNVLSDCLLPRLRVRVVCWSHLYSDHCDIILPTICSIQWFLKWMWSSFRRAHPFKDMIYHGRWRTLSVSDCLANFPNKDSNIQILKIIHVCTIGLNRQQWICI